jgi:hypothetical protein
MVFLWQLPTVINFSQGSFANATPKHLRNRRRWRGSAVQERTFRALVEGEAITSCAPSFNHIMCGIPSVWCLSVMTAARSALFQFWDICSRQQATHSPTENSHYDAHLKLLYRKKPAIVY